MAKQRTHTGASGQMFALAELLFRQCNAAVPEIDYGTDVFAFRDEREETARIQVKTAQGKRYKKGDGYAVQFGVPMRQLGRPDLPPLYYALVARVDGKWEDALVISRAKLNEYWNGPQRFGTEDPRSGDLKITIQFRDEVTCSDVNLTAYRNAWESLPPLRSMPELELQGEG